MIDKIAQQINSGELGIINILGVTLITCVKTGACFDCPLYSDNNRQCNANTVSEQVVPFLKDKYPELFI